ncbi:MAG TPA: hypothetical protein VFL51_03740 [Pseudolabrys sp.]|nr:hypothetical protein [Pseudolabrys sp.]
MTITAIYSTSTAATWQGSATSLFASVASYIGQFAEGAREGRTIEARYHELSQLSRADLAKCGLDRQSMARAALTGR